MAPSKRPLAPERAERLSATSEDCSPSDRSSSSDDDRPSSAARKRSRLRRRRRRGSDGAAVTAGPPATVRFLFEARDFPRLKSALVAAASAWVGPAGGVHASVDDAHAAGDVDDDVVLTVRATDADTAVRAVRAVWRRYAGRGAARWTADVLVDADAVYRAWRADAVWRVADRHPAARGPADPAVRVVRVRADAQETLRRVRRLMDMQTCGADGAAAAAAATDTDTDTDVDKPGPLAQGWSPSFQGAHELDLSSSSSSEDD